MFMQFFLVTCKFGLYLNEKKYLNDHIVFYLFILTVLEIFEFKINSFSTCQTNAKLNGNKLKTNII